MAVDVETRSALDEGLRDAEAGVLGEIDVVRGSLRTAVEAAVRTNQALAEGVVSQRDELERRYSDVHDRLMALIAR